MERKYFGTDGVRGVAGEPPLTPEFVLRLGQAAGAYFRSQTRRPVVLLGKDTRQSCDLLEAALAAGLMSQGVRVEHLGVLPTPGVAYLTRQLGATAGVSIFPRTAKPASNQPMPTGCRESGRLWAVRSTVLDMTGKGIDSATR